MHPAYSVIVFTVASGAGFGLLTLLGLAPLWGAPPVGGFGWTGFVLGFALSVGGLVSSTRHLGHPERAWRALTQWRSSWLSREGVLAIATLGVFGLYALGALIGGTALTALGAIGAALALVTVYATAMIYAQLKTVQRWNTPLTAVCYLLFALAGGALLYAAIRVGFAPEPTEAAKGAARLAGVLLLLAWIAKALWWVAGDRAAPAATPESATGLGHLGRVRLLESPHSGSSYLVREMGFRIARKHAAKLRAIALLLGGGAPFALALAGAAAASSALFAVAALAHLAGMLAERWLFFAEARHVVATYYDRG